VLIHAFASQCNVFASIQASLAIHSFKTIVSQPSGKRMGEGQARKASLQQNSYRQFNEMINTHFCVYFA
jgi:hypothetical protein